MTSSECKITNLLTRENEENCGCLLISALRNGTVLGSSSLMIPKNMLRDVAALLMIVCAVVSTHREFNRTPPDK